MTGGQPLPHATGITRGATSNEFEKPNEKRRRNRILCLSCRRVAYCGERGYSARETGAGNEHVLLHDVRLTIRYGEFTVPLLSPPPSPTHPEVVLAPDGGASGRRGPAGADHSFASGKNSRRRAMASPSETPTITVTAQEDAPSRGGRVPPTDPSCGPRADPPCGCQPRQCCCCCCCSPQPPDGCPPRPPGGPQGPPGKQGPAGPEGPAGPPGRRARADWRDRRGPRVHPGCPGPRVTQVRWGHRGHRAGTASPAPPGRAGRRESRARAVPPDPPAPEAAGVPRATRATLPAGTACANSSGSASPSSGSVRPADRPRTRWGRRTPAPAEARAAPAIRPRRPPRPATGPGRSCVRRPPPPGHYRRRPSRGRSHEPGPHPGCQ